MLFSGGSVRHPYIPIMYCAAQSEWSARKRNNNFCSLKGRNEEHTWFPHAVQLGERRRSNRRVTVVIYVSLCRRGCYISLEVKDMIRGIFSQATREQVVPNYMHHTLFLSLMEQQLQS